MIRKIIFKNSTVPFIQIESQNPVEIVSIGNNNKIDTMSLTPIGDNMDKNLIILDGNFNNTSIDVNSSCTLQSNSTFLCNNSIIVDTNENANVIFLGNFLSAGGVKLLNPCTIVSGTAVQLENLNVIIDYKDSNINSLNIMGDFSYCKVFVANSSNINLDGIVGEIVINSNVSDVSLNLLPESTVNDMKAESKILVTGDKLSVDNLLNNTSEGLDNIIVLYNTFIIDTLNGQSIIPLVLSNTGKYRISASILEDINEVSIGVPIEIEII